MATISNDNALDQFLNPTYLFPIIGVLSGFTVYLLGFNKTSSTPPTIQLFSSEKEKKTPLSGKKEKKKDANVTTGLVTKSSNSPAKSSQVQANSKTTTPVAAKKVKNVAAEKTQKSKASGKQEVPKVTGKKGKKSDKQKENEVVAEVDQSVLQDLEDGEWRMVNTVKKRKDKKDEPSKKESKKEAKKTAKKESEEAAVKDSKEPVKETKKDIKKDAKKDQKK